MPDEIQPVPVSPFEQIRQEAPAGDEYWSARDLATVLGYTTNYRNFRTVLERAAIACANSGQQVADHFAEARKMITLGKGGQRDVEDMHLSRYACYLVVQNADPTKAIVALGQTYFAVQTRRQEQADELAGLSEADKRLYLRRQLSEHNRQLAATAYQAGVMQGADFAIFQDHGYRGLYGGLGARDIHTRKGLKKSQPILDHMGSEELAANLFRATQTEAKIRREGVQGKQPANQAHYQVGRKVRQTIAELGGTMPEDLPTPAESIQRLEQADRRQRQRGSQLELFTEQDAPTEEE